MITHGIGFNAKLPSYFYDIKDSRRWYDEFSTIGSTGEESERMVLTPAELKARYQRNKAYARWLSRHGLRPKQMRWQRVRVVNDKYQESSTSLDWWPEFYGAIFTVFQQPETLKEGKKWIQYYVLAPEDSEMVLRYKASKLGITIPPRIAPWIHQDKSVTNVLVLPTRCASNLRNETKAGIQEYLGHI
jgi:hypothetical protein